jgi:hypothetical protein
MGRGGGGATTLFASQGRKAFFFEKKSSKKLLIILASACPDRPKPRFAKVFWFFFSKKNGCLPRGLCLAF